MKLTESEQKELTKIKSHCRRTYVTIKEVVRMQELERKLDARESTNEAKS